MIVLSIGLILLTFGIGEYGFYEPHEGHFGGVAYEMLLRGDWVTPTLNGAAYLNKPPLLYWLIAASTALFGVTEWAARLPLALAGWLGIVVAWQWARELWGGSAGRAAALMLSVTLGWFIFTHQLLIDVLLATLVLGTYYCLWRLIWEPKDWRTFFALYILLGLCLLAKGPLGVALPLLGCIGLVLSRRSWAVFRKIKPIRGIAVILAVILPWFIAVERANPGFLYYFLYNEHLKRIFDTRFPPDYEVSKVSALGYLAITAVWCLPWTLLLPQVVSSARREMKKRGRHSEGVLLLIIATLSPIVLFLPLSSRLVYYSLPVLPPYVILCAGWWASNHSRRTQPVVLGIVFAGLGLVVGSAVWASSLVQFSANNPALKELIAPIALGIGLGLLVSGILLLVRHLKLSLIALLIGFASAYTFIPTGFAAYQDLRSSKTLVKTANSCLGNNTLWTFEGSRELGTAGAMSYYLNQPQNAIASRNYRTVLVLSDGGSNRILPQFPGSPPEYAVTKAELQEYWDSGHPVVFVTDFLRQPNDPSDPLKLNLPDGAGEPLLVIGTRKLYGNVAARKLWCGLSQDFTGDHHSKAT